MSAILFEEDIEIKGLSKTGFQLDSVIKILLSSRQLWKKTGKYAVADEIRRALKEIGILVLDKKDGSVTYKNDKHALSDLFTPTGERR